MTEASTVPEPPLQVLAVIGSLSRTASTRQVVAFVADQMRAGGASVDVLDLLHEPLHLFNPDTAHGTDDFKQLKARVERADVFLLGTPDYHGSIPGVMKNFLDHFWREFAGKLFATIVASHEKGLTVTDQFRTVARQCYAWTLAYGVSYSEPADIKDHKIISDSLKDRLEMLAQDTRVYGTLLARQRRADLAGQDPGFMAIHRKKS
jgi:NAD(P)H-dependent FMN reductase